MQFLESSYVGLRSAVHLLGSKEASPRFLVIPMVHIGDRSFYEEVARRLGECQTIIHEDVPGFRAKLFTQAYRITARNRSLDLVLQRDILQISNFDARKIHADVTAAGHSAHWRTLPWLRQLGLLVLAPVYGCWTYLFATRRSLARGRSTDSLSNAYALGDADSTIAVRDIVVTKRDERIVSRIDQYLKESGEERELTAIVFGAGHMPAIVAHLMEKHGYSSIKAEWLSTISIP